MANSRSGKATNGKAGGRPGRILGLFALALLAALGGLFWILEGGGSSAVLGNRSEVDQAEGREGPEPGLRAGAGKLAAEDLAQVQPAAAAPTGRVAMLAPELATFAGTVVEEQGGDPVAGATIQLSAGERTLSVESDAEGRFELEWPAETPAALSVVHERYSELRRRESELVPGQTFQLRRRAAIVGEVTALGALRLDQGRVYLWGRDQRGPQPKGELELALDDSGRFRFEGLNPGEYSLAAHLQDGPLTVRHGILVESGETYDLSLAVQVGAELRGQVLVSGGTPVAGAELEVRSRAQGLSSHLGRLGAIEAVSGPDGSFRLLGLATGRNDVRIRPPWGGEERKSVQVDTAGELIDEDFELRPAAQLSGIVRDPSGLPVGAARVLVASTQRQQRALKRFFEGGDPLEELDEEEALVGRCDTRGNFTIERLPAQRSLTVVAFPPAERDDLVPCLGKQLSLKPGQMSTGYDLRLEFGLSLSGLVLDAQGGPVEGAELSCALIDRNRSFKWRRAESDVEGRFALSGLVPGKLRVSVEAEGFLDQRSYVTLSEGEAPTPLELLLEPSFEVSGWVVDPQGFAIAGASVRVSEGQANTERSRRYQRRATSDEFGAFRVEDIPVGDWSVEAWAAAWRSREGSRAALSLPGAGSLVLTLEPRERQPRSEVYGEVTLAPDGSIPERLRIDGRRGGLVSVDGGRFQIHGVRAGKTTLEFRADHALTAWSDELSIEPGVALDLGRVVLQPATRLSIKLVDQAGRPVNGARVRLYSLAPDKGGYSGKSKRLNLRRRRNGQYVYEKTPRFSWRLDVRASGHKRVQRRLRIKDQERQTLKLTLERQGG